MHYIPPTLTEVVPPPDQQQPDQRNPAVPLYLLTAVVGILLGTDTVLSWIDDPAWNTYRSISGFRLALVAAVVGGARILYQTLEGLLEGRIGADLALTLACLAAIVLGEPSVAALVVFIALCGESLEGYIGTRASGALLKLFALTPKMARVLRDGQETDLPLSQINVGDVVVIRPGERIPCDGKILNGSSTVDQSSLTGESLPVDKTIHEQVYAGTLNQLGALTISVEKIGRDTTFGQIVELVSSATRRKTELERTADRLARYFLPVVLGVAFVTLVGWRINSGNWRAGWLPALSVLVVACPCPLILATPSAVLASLAWLARNGVVIKGSAALERLALVDTIAFDKTGTLTTGQPAIGDIFCFGLVSEDDVIRIAAAAERYSEHVLGQMIVGVATQRNLELPVPQSFTATPGAGVIASFSRQSLEGTTKDQRFLLRGGPEESCQVRVGNLRFFESQNLRVGEHLQNWLAALDDSGQTPILVAIQETVIGLIGARDSVRTNAGSVIKSLRETGIKHIAVLTGDRLPAARQVVQAIGPVETVAAESMPAEKAQWIENRQQSGARVLMIGDGINDAPALAMASVGIAIGGVGSQIASEAGDMILMGQPLAPLPGLLRLSRELIRVIHQSIYWFAFGLNGLGVLLCALGWLNPVGAALFHEIASLAVMFNALRLLWFERWNTTSTGRMAAGCSKCIEFLVDTLSPSNAAQNLVRHAALISRLLLAGLAGVWLLSNLVLVSSDETALVTRFGKHQANLEAGLYWRWPWPFERVQREAPGRLRSLQVGFRSKGVRETSEEFTEGPIEWQAEHQDALYQPISAESDLLSGEEVPVELTAEVVYRIQDLGQYLYEVSRSEDILRSLTERSLRQTVAKMALEDILTGRRVELATNSLALIRERSNSYGLGIEIVGLNLLDIHPPVAIVPNYRDVANALEEREQLLNEAQTTYVKEMYSSIGQKGVEILEAAGSRNAERKGDATAKRLATELPNWKFDDALWNQLSKDLDSASPITGIAGELLHTARQSETEQVQAATADASRFNELIVPYQNQPRLTRLHLYWTALEKHLSAASLTIVDPSSRGRQHFLMTDGSASPLVLPGPSGPLPEVPPTPNITNPPGSALQESN